MKKWIVSASVISSCCLLAWQALAASPAPQPDGIGPPGGNQPPICCFGPACQQTGIIDIVKCAGLTTTVTLDASQSSDPDGDPITFLWTACPGSTIADPTAAVTTLTIDTSAVCERNCGVRLMVSDGKTASFCRLFVRVLDNLNACEAKPRQLEFVYTGEDCFASNFVQDPGGVSCVGDPFYASPVRVLVTKANTPSRVYFDGMVDLGGSFVVDGFGQPSGKVPPNTRVQIFDQSGSLLQQSIFHTSCSQPLEVGDQFGGVILTDFTP